MERDEPAERLVQAAVAPWELTGSDSSKPVAVRIGER